MITRFNIWDYELQDSVINERSLVCGEEEGSIIAWPEVKLWTFDGLEVIERDDCFPGRYTHYFVFQLQGILVKILVVVNFGVLFSHGSKPIFSTLGLFKYVRIYITKKLSGEFMA